MVVSARTAREPDRVESISDIRSSIVETMARIALVAGSVALLLGSIDPVIDRNWLLLAIYVVAFAGALVFLLPRRIPKRLRGTALLVLICGVAVSEMAYFAFNSAGFLLFFFAALLGGWFFSMRAAGAVVVVSLVATAAVIVAYTVLPVDLSIPQRQNAGHWTNWVAPTFTYGLVVLSGLVLTARVVRQLEQWEEQARTGMADLALALANQRTLTRELHHRVRNNLQLLSSMTRLELESSGHSSSEAFAQAVGNRIEMVSLAHGLVFDEDSAAEVERPVDRVVRAAVEASCQRCRPAVRVEAAGAAPLPVGPARATTLALLFFELSDRLLSARRRQGDAEAVTIEFRSDTAGAEIRVGLAGTDRKDLGPSPSELVDALCASARATVVWASAEATLRVTVSAEGA